MGSSRERKKKKFNWGKYENGRDDEIRKLAELLKAVIWQLANRIK